MVIRSFMKEVRTKVPATTANLGPGFDCLGIALRIYNEVIVRAAPGHPDGMADQAAEAFFTRADIAPFDFDWSVKGQVPRSRGMGSSVTVRLGLLHGLNELADGPLSDVALYQLCCDLEGHPDNAAPAAFGGFTVARKDASFQRYKVSKKLRFVLLVPDFEVETPAARKALPERIPFKDAVVSASNAAAISAAFASGEYENLRGTFTDYLHQPYRLPLIPCLNDVIAAGEKAGAIGGWLSGSGSTIACVTLADPEKVARAMQEASGLKNTEVFITQADNKGVRVKVRS
jgi:homoserine kinase